MTQPWLDLTLFGSGLVCSTGGSLLIMYSWAATNPARHTPPGKLEEVLPLRGKHLATAAAPLLYMWGGSAVLVGVLVGGFGLLNLYSAAYGVLLRWPAGWRLAGVVLLSALLLYGGTRVFRWLQAPVYRHLRQASQVQRLSGRAFCQLAASTSLLWCCLALVSVGIALTDQLSRVYP